MNLKILLDQNIPFEIAGFIKSEKENWEVTHTLKIYLSTKKDSEIFSWAQENNYLIITFDEDFADQKSFPVNKHCGIIRLKVWPTIIEEVKIALKRLFEKFSDEEIYGSLIIIDKNKIKLRKT
ncbi:MAG: DUF5615 family PIN-like protein [Spirochaetia bacterium]|nr:DUF5615 family PIN-like protein [Spirochaetia bacterium]